LAVNYPRPSVGKVPPREHCSEKETRYNQASHMTTVDPGSRLGHYTILAKIGEGGMGAVYRARDDKLGRDVAIKVLPADVAASPMRLERFHREARTLGALNHPGIVTLYGIEEGESAPFLAMELVEGQSLAAHVSEGGWPVERVLEIGIALADALDAAHSKGIVHRDFKPGNVMLGDDGRVKVLDFGLARIDEPVQLDSESPTNAAPLTRIGQVLGTVSYMAPEQVRGERVDSRADLFSLGVVLYELATGRRPFRGSSTADISSAILRDSPPSLSSVRADVPLDLERIIRRCLEKERDARFEKASEVSDALRNVRAGSAPRAVVDADAILKPPPLPSTPLLGRESALDDAVEILREGARVLTITGYGGIGKTRFSIELYRRLTSEYPGGAAFVSLASVTDASEVMPTVTAALEIAEAHGRSALDTLCTVIGERRVLLILDNLEQVLGAAEDIAMLASRCPALQVVATTRAPLKIGAEHEFALERLALPEKDARAMEAIAHCASVELFVQRAARVKPGFALTESNAASIAAICRGLDGLPLALELAAARARILEPAALLQRLDHALDLLTSGDRDLPMRQRTLRATISWSYSLLEPDEQRLLRWLSTFREGWTLEALEQVCYSNDDRYRALDELDSLVENGLVRVVGSGERYALLETIRAFAAEQLHAGGEVESARSAHADYYLEFAAAVWQDLRGTGQVEAMVRAGNDNENTLAAISWLLYRARSGDEDSLEKVLLMCGYLDWYWHMRGLHLTARVFLDEALALAADRSPTKGRGLAKLAAGMVSTTTGEWDRSLGEWAGGRDDGNAVGDEPIAAEGAMGVGYCHLNEGRLDESAVALEEAIRRSAGGVDDFMHAISLTLEGMRLFATGDLEQGIATVKRAHVIQERLQDCEGGGVALSFLAQMTFAKEDADGALEYYRQALQAFETVGDRPEVARVLCEMGWALLAGSDARAATRSFRKAVLAYEEIGSPRGTGLALLGLAAVEAAEGRPGRAVTIAAAADALSKRAGVVVDHPMDPGLTERIEALKATIPKGELDGLVESATELTPAAILAMIAEG